MCWLEGSEDGLIYKGHYKNGNVFITLFVLHPHPRNKAYALLPPLFCADRYSGSGILQRGPSIIFVGEFEVRHRRPALATLFLFALSDKAPCP